MFNILGETTFQPWEFLRSGRKVEGGEKEEEERNSRWKQWPASLRPPPRVPHASTKKVGENNGQLYFVRHHEWRTQASLDQKLVFPSVAGTHAIIARRHQHKIDLNQSLILIVMILIFFMFHIPRVIISIYEAFTIQRMIKCSQKGLGYYHIWYLYGQAVSQFLQVFHITIKGSYWTFKGTFDQLCLSDPWHVYGLCFIATFFENDFYAFSKLVLE